MWPMVSQYHAFPNFAKQIASTKLVLGENIMVTKLIAYLMKIYNYHKNDNVLLRISPFYY